tara:strand:- start:1293 stop:2306 length:1014 start_codon:yes stop_codon:yes gene_type:complete
MRFTIENYNNFDKNSWNNVLESMEGNLHLCTWQSLEYYSAFKNIRNVSFIVKEENQIKAMVPLAVNKNKQNLLSFNEGFIFLPVFKYDIKKSLRKKIYDFIFEHIKLNFNKYKIVKFLSLPVNFHRNKVNISSKNQFELLSKKPKINIQNTLIQNLKKSTSELENQMSKYHLKNINKTSKMNIEFKIFNKDTSTDILSKEFENFKKLHFLSAGRSTRPIKTWKLMETQVKDNLGDLFSLRYEGKAISYLFCGRYKDFSWGWSQVNLRKYEKKVMPRHVLEWKAMLYYKNMKQSYYEIGIRYHEHEKFKPTKKELSISEFKEKYGSDSYPRSELSIRI